MLWLLALLEKTKSVEIDKVLKAPRFPAWCRPFGADEGINMPSCSNLDPLVFHWWQVGIGLSIALLIDRIVAWWGRHDCKDN